MKIFDYLRTNEEIALLNKMPVNVSVNKKKKT